MSLNIGKIINLALASLIVAAPALAEAEKDKSESPGAKTRLAKEAGCEGSACHKGARAKFSDEQLEKMSALKKQFLDGTQAKRSELETLGREMKALFTAQEIDRGKALELQGKIAATRAELSKAKLNYRLDQLALLTPEQKQEMRHRFLMKSSFGHHGHHKFSGSHGSRFHGHHGFHSDIRPGAGGSAEKA